MSAGIGDSNFEVTLCCVLIKNVLEAIGRTDHRYDLRFFTVAMGNSASPGWEAKPKRTLGGKALLDLSRQTRAGLS